MSENTKIEWCDHTFNPWEGCVKVGPGCDHCYAEARNARFGGGMAINWGPGAPRRRTSPANWALPVKWNKRTGVMQSAWAHGVALQGGDEAACIAAGYIKPTRPKVFCSSLADVFDNSVDPKWRDDLFTLIANTQNLDWLLLTKRIGNASTMLPWLPGYTGPDGQRTTNTWRNVWIGATIVNQEEADRDIPKLLAVPAHKRFLSMEPLLGPVDLGAWLEPWEECGYCGESFDFEIGRPDQCPECCQSGCMSTGFGSDLRKEFDDAMGKLEVPEGPEIHWVIVGGESGPNARPMHPDWARSLRDQCQAAGVRFLFKQWGEFLPIGQILPGFGKVHGATGVKPGRMKLHYGGTREQAPKHAFADHGVDFASTDDGRLTFRVGKKAAGRLLDGITHDGYPS